MVSFRTGKDSLANNSRVTNVVIDDFTNPERFASDIWIALYGKGNRVDHNTLLNKGNAGVTLAVRMNTEASRENEHIVDFNYFGPRQTLGSNGGETLRIGTSHYSREFSNTTVQNNYFDRTSGELEIISSKACGNTIRNNVFFESQGTLTLRHGHFTEVNGNYFLVNRKPNTGGIRVINENQTVRGNYLSGLTGYRFRGALVVMNGVPNGPVNRYDPVVNSVIENNLIVDSDHIQLCAGADAERSAPPTGTSMRNNLFMSSTNPNLFTVYDDISGIEFENNVINDEIEAPVSSGFSRAPYFLVDGESGLREPDPSLLDQIAFGHVRLPVTKDQTGADFYPKTDRAALFGSGKAILVPPGVNTLLAAIDTSAPGDELILEGGGSYLLTKFASIRHPLTIRTDSSERPVIRSEKSTFLFIEDGGALKLKRLHFDGAESPDLYGNNVISTSRYSMIKNYSLIVEDCLITNLNVNHSFNFLGAYKCTFADRIEIIGTKMENITGSVLPLNKEPENLGIYNVENVVIRNSHFVNIQGAVADNYRGGTDESTFGPIVTVADSLFENVGRGSRNQSDASLKFHGVQLLDVSNSTWIRSAPLALFLTNGEPITRIRDVIMQQTPPIKSNNDGYEVQGISYQ